MKKIVCILLLIQSGFIIGQIKTVVSPYGEKIQVDTSPQWILDGNNNGAVKTIGTNDAFDLPIETNNVERMRVTSTGQVLINTTTPLTGGTNAKVQISSSNAGALQVKDGTEAPGRVLTSNADGVATWQEGQKSNFKSFKGNLTTDLSLLGNVATSIPGINDYTVPSTGKYELIFHSLFYNLSVSEMKSFYVMVSVNGVLYSSDETYAYVTAGNYLNVHYPTIVLANQGDVIGIKIVAAIGAPFTIPAALAGRNRLDVIFLGV